jgi:hypothetical protein
MRTQRAVSCNILQKLVLNVMSIKNKTNKLSLQESNSLVLYNSKNRLTIKIAVANSSVMENLTFSNLIIGTSDSFCNRLYFFSSKQLLRRKQTTV